MGWQQITNGDKIGKPKSAKYIKSKNGNEGIEITFEFEEPSTGTKECLGWIGWLSEKARDNTIDVLLNTLGSNGNVKHDNNGFFVDPNFLRFNTEVKLVVEGEAYVNPNTGIEKVYPKIKWVNSLGGSNYAGCSVDECGDGLMALKAAAIQNKPPVKNYAPGAFNEKLPF